MLGFPFLEAGFGETVPALGVVGAFAAGDSSACGSRTSSGSFVVTPKKLATVSQEVFSRDFSDFGFSEATSGEASRSPEETAGFSAATGTELSVLGF